jgi:hypothetical protein
VYRGSAKEVGESIDTQLTSQSNWLQFAMLIVACFLVLVTLVLAVRWWLLKMRSESDHWMNRAREVEVALNRKTVELKAQLRLVEIVEKRAGWDKMRHDVMVVDPDSDECPEVPDKAVPPTGRADEVQRDQHERTVMPNKPARLYGRPDDAQPARQRRGAEEASSSSAAAAAATESSDANQGGGGIFPPPAPEFSRAQGKGKGCSSSSNPHEDSRAPPSPYPAWPGASILMDKPCTRCMTRVKRNKVWIATKRGTVYHIDPECGKLEWADAKRVKDYSGRKSCVPPWKIP